MKKLRLITKTHTAIACLFTLLVISCVDSETNTQEALADISFIRIDKEITQAQSAEELGTVFKKYNFYTRSLYRTFPTDTALAHYVYELVNHPDTKAFYQETLDSYGDFAQLKREFAQAFQNITKKYPSFKAPKIYTTFTGLENDIYVSDSLVILSLESFLGEKASYRPAQPNYILERYTQEHIVPQVIRLLSTSFIEHGQGTSLLNDMTFFGKTFEFTKVMIPDAKSASIIGYPDSSMVNTWYAQDIVWAHFVEKQLLYEQSPRVKQKYIGERPFVSEIGPACPGRIGQWLGWRIIQKFRTENPEVSFQELMKMKDAEEILRMSKYRGEIEEP